RSGYDFVNSDHDFFDDHAMAHGSVVSHVINDKLKEYDVPHKILPVKVADAAGVASYFDIVCGMSYALPRCHMMNFSIGWQDNSGFDPADDPMDTIMNTLISNYEDKVLFITSAGNSGQDNDTHPHFPSNYPNPNILVVAAAKNSGTEAWSLTNFGENEVDLYSDGFGINFLDMANNSLSFSGTSFSTPHIAAIAARVRYSTGLTNPLDIKAEIVSMGIPVNYSGKATLYDRYVAN
ncbi:MAG: S8 family serine peptidase, partial [Flavobacteriaceae bacterium]|nr:S8 family serine peptidase [Flavobacteriaceae bacterium]